MKFRFVRYSLVFIIPLLTFFGIYAGGWWTFSTVIFGYLLVPAMEFLFSKQSTNLDDEVEQAMLLDKRFDYLLYAMVPIQYSLLILYAYAVSTTAYTTPEFIGVTASMGVTCGVVGINVAHELGHRKKPFERFLAKALLLSSLYMHFIIEHNRGHHKHVATPADPATARRGEPLQLFWLRSGLLSYFSAWKIENDRLRKNGIRLISWSNEMIRFQLIQIVLLAGLYFLFGFWPTIGFLIAALIGILQLETVNYIEHYGLSRKLGDNQRYERVQPWHSWNSNHMMGRLMLFELSRHSDHHYLASRKYQVLRHHQNSPQMPTGYPGMMLLSLVPPLWFWVMNTRINHLYVVTNTP